LGPFWHGHKRFPNTLEYDSKDELHVDYIYAYSSILAHTFGLPPKTREEVRAASSAIRAAPWVAGSGKVDMSEGKPDASEVKVDDDEKKQIADLKASLLALDISKLKKLQSNDFEKDDDTNHHIDFITSATNLRCINYNIKPTTRANCRLTAGKIIPAIATTTAMITGFVGLEVLKYIKGVPLEAHRAATCNLSTNVFCVENLPDPLKKKTGLDAETYMQCTAIPEGFTTWDKIEIKGAAMTIGQLLEQFPKIHRGAVLGTITTVGYVSTTLAFASLPWLFLLIHVTDI
jgi:ubiquitin-activating enzyme E1